MKNTLFPPRIAMVLAGILLGAVPMSALAEGTMFVVDDKVGVGTETPDEKLHVKDGNLKVQQPAGTNATLFFTTGANTWEIKQNEATGRLTFFTPGGGATTASFKFDRQAKENLFRVGVVAADVVDINGNLVINGSCSEYGSGSCADYVFDPDYELRSIGELEGFIQENGHLPNVPSADDMEKNGVSVAHLSGRLLEKIEELTLYTVQQQKLIDELQASVDELRAERK